MSARKVSRHWVNPARPLKNRSPPPQAPRQGNISEEALAAAVGRVMQNPAMNVQWMPDMVEYYVHKQAVQAMLSAIAAVPPMYLYGHKITLCVEPE
jgi:hypothetical protein